MSSASIIFTKHMLDKESNIDFVDIQSLKHSDCYSDCLGLNDFINYSHRSQSSHHLAKKSQRLSKKEPSVHENNGQQCYEILFSPQQTTKSLIKRNQHLEMKCFQDSESEMEDIYERRKKRVSALHNKQNRQRSIFMNLQVKQYSKYNALVSFLNIFATIKSSMNHIRNDYYSNKTFTALKNTPEHELRNATKVTNSLLYQVMSMPIFSEDMIHQDVDERLIEFLIIPRFLISKQKMLKFIKDDQLRNNLKFLVYSGCLGHYNNQANKKLPDQSYMQYVRSLVIKKEGRQKYKKICSINHGSRYITYNKAQYYKLFTKSLSCLRHIDQQIKKKKIKLDQIAQQLQKFSLDHDMDEQNQNENELKLSSMNNQTINQHKLVVNAWQFVQGGDMLSVSNYLNSSYKQNDDGLLLLTKSDSKQFGVEQVPRVSKLKKANSLPVNAYIQLPAVKVQAQTGMKVSKMKRAQTFQIVAPPVAISQAHQQLEEDRD